MTLNVNGLLQSRHIVAKWIKKINKTQYPPIYCLQEAHFRSKTESEEIEKDTLYKWKQKESCGSNTHIGQNRL